MLHNPEEYATLLWTELQQSTAANEQIYFFNSFLCKLILSNEFSLTEQPFHKNCFFQLLLQRQAELMVCSFLISFGL